MEVPNNTQKIKTKSASCEEGPFIRLNWRMRIEIRLKVIKNPTQAANKLSKGQRAITSIEASSRWPAINR